MPDLNGKSYSSSDVESIENSDSSREEPCGSGQLCIIFMHVMRVLVHANDVAPQPQLDVVSIWGWILVQQLHKLGNIPNSNVGCKILTT